MSVNKFMHPRNIYKTPPNFKQMAIDYPEFRKYVKQDITGKIRIDFKSNETLRALSQTLLKKDFDLDIIIPLDRLIPTIPLRLNYILWIEDLLNTEETEAKEGVFGIDIGTGAACIYPVLASKLHKWFMTATELDQQSLNIAQENVQRNHLQHLILIKQADGSTLLKNMLQTDRLYDFCMCNPPFFSSASELDPFFKARSDRRAPPRNAMSGSLGEVVVSGGEIEFVKKLIRESVEINKQIRIFTTMVGHKSSLVPLKALLREVEVISFKQTEFHQGHTTRWGLAWTFFNIDLRKIPQATVTAGKKKLKPPLKFTIPALVEHVSFEIVIGKVREILQSLQMEYEEIKRNQQMYAMQVTAKENTWSHQRRKRRQQVKNQPMDIHQNGGDIGDGGTGADTSTESMDCDKSPECVNHKRGRSESDDEEYYNVKKIRTNDSAIPVYLKINVIVKKFDCEYVLEMSLIEGSAPKDSVHQVMQYFKNYFK